MGFYCIHLLLFLPENLRNVRQQLAMTSKSDLKTYYLSLLLIYLMFLENKRQLDFGPFLSKKSLEDCFNLSFWNKILNTTLAKSFTSLVCSSKFFFPKGKFRSSDFTL